MPQSLEDALTYSDRWLEIIHRPQLSDEEGKAIIAGRSPTSPTTSTRAGWNTESR